MNKPPSREKALLETIRRGLQLSAERQTQAILGKRDSYIGMSDLGRYAECPRAAVANKLFPQPCSLERLLTLQRGHWFESGVRSALLAANLNHVHQLEIHVRHRAETIKAHLDFALVWEKPVTAVRILEVKSTEKIPELPRNAHAIQAQGQVDLLRHYWNKPVFSLRDEAGTLLHENVSFPQLCRERFGLELSTDPRSISTESWLLYLSMKEARAFGPYEYSPESLADLFSQAQAFQQHLNAGLADTSCLGDLPVPQGYHPLCTACEYNADCPKFPQGASQPQWNAALTKLEELKASRTVLDNEIREVEAALKQAHQLSGTTDWISTGQYRFRTATIAGRRTLDREAFCRELEALCATGDITSIDMPALFQRHEREGTPSTRLSITPINQ